MFKGVFFKSLLIVAIAFVIMIGAFQLLGDLGLGDWGPIVYTGPLFLIAAYVFYRIGKQ